MSRYILPVHKSKWNQIKSDANCGDVIDNVDQSAYVASLNRASKQLMEKWENSYENVMRRHEKERAVEKINADFNNMEFYIQLMEDKRKEKDKIMADARDTFFKQMDEPKVLLSAFLCSEMLKEQQGQRDFNKRLKDEQKTRDMDYVLYLRGKCKEWKKEQIKKHEQITKKNIEESFLMKKRAEREKQNAIDEQNRKTEWEKLNREIAQKELKALEEQELRIKAKNHQIFIDNIHLRLNVEKCRRAEDEALRIKEIKLADIYNNTQNKINELCRQRQREIEKYKTKRRDIVRATFIDNTEKIKMHEDELNKKANEEKRKREKEIVEKENAHKAKIKEEKIRSHKEWLDFKSQKLREKDGKMSNEINASKENQEYTKGLKDKLRAEYYKKNNEIKKFNLMQMKENAEKKKCEDAEKFKFYRDDRLADMESADMKFFEFAHQLLEECEAAGRPMQPLHKVIRDYKRRYLHPREKLYKDLNNHFPLFQRD